MKRALTTGLLAAALFAPRLLAESGFNRYDPDDAIITLETTPTPSMGVGHEGVTSYRAQAYAYAVVPWPRGEAAAGDAKEVRVTWTGLVPGSTNVVEAGDPVVGTWITNLVFIATAVTHTVTLPATNATQTLRVRAKR